LENPSSKKSKSTFILVFILLAIFISQAILSMKIKSPTFDEPFHLISGYLAITKQSFKLGAEHPPLTKSLAALPLLFTDITLPDNGSKLSSENHFLFGQKFLFQSENDVEKIIFLGRLPIVFLSALLGLYVYLWARSIYGEKSGLFALILYVFSPNILAHSRLVTTDLGLTCFLFITCYYFRLYLEFPSNRKLFLAGLAFGLALTSKYSGLILFPILFILLSLKLYLFKNFSSYDNLKNFLSIENSKMGLLKHFYIFIFPLILMIFLAYQFQPNALFLYLEGLEALQAIHFTPHPLVPNFLKPHYLWGTFSYNSIWYYPLIVFLLKTPVPTIILLVMVLALLARTKKVSFNTLCLIIPVLLIFAMNYFDIAHPGLRRILPIYPFIFVIASRVIYDYRKVDFYIFKKAAFSITLTIMLLWYVISSVKIFPDYLTYFNEFISEPQEGINYLDGSNIDWGQDLKSLKSFMDQEGIKKIKLIFYGTADPKYYGIQALPLTQDDLKKGPHSGDYAISAHLLNRFKRIPSLAGFSEAWKKDHKPIKIIGNTIYVFKFDSP
jgi:hypothetical protein